MKLIAQLQLKPTPEQKRALLATMERANEACNYISQVAWETQTFGQFKLHHKTYNAAKERFGLSAQVVVRCIAKVVDAYKLDKKTQRTFKPHGAISYDDRILTYKLDKSEVSIWLLGEKRAVIPFVCGERQQQLLATRQGESDLALVKGKWFLLATCNVEELEPSDTNDGTLGVDMGIVELATDSNGTSYSGAQTKAVRRRYKRIRGLLQKRGTKSAKRHLKKLSRKQANFVRSENHRISKQIVKTAKVERKALALENLKGIKERSNSFSREMRWQMGNWAFNQLQGFISYKAQRDGVPVTYVEAAYTSRTCSACGYCDKANRKSQAHFSCIQCGFELNADFNAAINIGTRALVNAPIVVYSQNTVRVGTTSPAPCGRG
jgi:putative transposase